jgi:hypothetical protein
MNSRISLLRSLRVATLLAGASLVSLTLRDAKAAWPPASGADMSDPSNWPNDPGYAGCLPPSTPGGTQCGHADPNPTSGGQWNF